MNLRPFTLLEVRSETGTGEESEKSLLNSDFRESYLIFRNLSVLTTALGKPQGPFRGSSLCNILMFLGNLSPSKPGCLTSDLEVSFWQTVAGKERKDCD